jgi:hypothetical protein
MKLSQLLPREVKAAMRNLALDCEAGRYAQKVKGVRRERSNSAAAGRGDNGTNEKMPRECKCRDGRLHSKENHYARYFKAEKIFSIDLRHPDKEMGIGRLIIFEGACPKCGGVMYKGETLCDYRLTGTKLLWATVETVMLVGSRYGLTMSIEKAWSEVNRFFPASGGKFNPRRFCYGSKNKT